MSTLTYQLFSPQTYAFLIRSRLQLRNYAAGIGTRSRSLPTPRMQPQKSFQLSLKELAGAEILDDVGILPGRCINLTDQTCALSTM